MKRLLPAAWKVGLVRGDHLSVDGSFIEANAAKESRMPREQLEEVAQVNRTVRQYLVELEEQNPVEEPVHQQEQVSTTDPDSTYATKGGTPARLGYYDNYLIDNHSCVIVGVAATAARLSQETVAAQDMITRFAEWQGQEPASLAADTTYGNGEFLHWLLQRGITPYMRTRENALKQSSPLYGPERFTYQPESNRYLCPDGKQLQYVGISARNRTHALYQHGEALPCMFPEGAMHERQVQDLTSICMNRHASKLANWQRHLPSPMRNVQRKKVEALFAELKNQIGMRRLRLRRMKFVREQFFLAAAAQNIKRLVRFLSKAPSSPLAATA